MMGVCHHTDFDTSPYFFYVGIEQIEHYCKQLEPACVFLFPIFVEKKN
ncbi:hypothetical protein HMPREF2533_03073 [Bacteroides fragilis]|nr:hypothetical protein HMPREF2530_03073 [Bacteroides fragilis]KXU43879.1 hypothetical protein HMPREF2533_03073 [Bacteroides fragilis]